MSGAVYELKSNQLKAVTPEESVWLSASAGTGKTQVLSARVLRLLLEPNVEPADILCLTFTKAGAAEMAVRINDVLARWVRLDAAILAKELGYVGADIGPETQARARTLFASVLDCPGGGLRIDTIHAFAQWLLANFPGEADIMPGARPMEDRERDLLSREVLADVLVTAQREGNAQLLDSVAEFSRRKGPDALRSWVMRCANLGDLWSDSAAWQGPLKPQVHAMLGMPDDAGEDWVAEALGPDVFPDEVLIAMRPVLQDWGTQGALKMLDSMGPWLAASADKRLHLLNVLDDAFHTKQGTPRAMKKPTQTEPRVPEWQANIAEAVAFAKERQTLLALAEFLTLALEIGRSFAADWSKAKAREGLLDFDDLIQRAAKLLQGKDASDWIRFKLDRQFNHILVDEAQDTNAAQWKIFDALIDDFFSGEGASGDATRTVFTVGDYKQAIFGFQGTSPENFEAAKGRVADAIRARSQNAATARRGEFQGELGDYELGRSFRTSKTVLALVDRVIAGIGPSAFGLKDAEVVHDGEDRPGLVTLWNPVRDQQDKADDSDEEAEGWLARHDRLMADKIAEQVAQWTLGTQPYVLAKDGAPRKATPGDIMVLVRSRKELAGLIVARLHKRGVPVAGVDRLRLGAPLAVKDLMAALRFAAQPLDDLELANLLSSPLIGWTQDDLLKYVPREKGQSLWRHLRDLDEPLVTETRAKLLDLLGRADFDNPGVLLNWLLVGPWQGRERLVSRLGHEANDPIDELLNAADSFEVSRTPSLAAFIQWFDIGEGELKRDMGETPDLVRVMTVHGSKGLEAPIVILADATGEPGSVGELSLDNPVSGGIDTAPIPLPGLKSEERAGPVAEAHEEASISALQEHWRLLYVAMTRAQEALFIGGSLSPRMKDKPPPEDSWYARIEPQMGDLALEDNIWGGRREWGTRAQLDGASPAQPAAPAIILPDWAKRAVGDEPKPPRPLAPSKLGGADDLDPPTRGQFSPEAARRGVLIHALLERLPDIAPDQRADRATAWLAQFAKDVDEAERTEMAQHACQVLAEESFAAIFGQDGLAEVPFSAVVAGQVVAGTIDRLLVDDAGVMVLDYKTARNPPGSQEAIPASTLRQMAAYVAAMEVIYPGKRVRAGVLYTQTPQLFELPPEMLAQHKSGFSPAQ